MNDTFSGFLMNNNENEAPYIFWVRNGFQSLFRDKPAKCEISTNGIYVKDMEINISLDSIKSVKRGCTKTVCWLNIKYIYDSKKKQFNLSPLSPLFPPAISRFEIDQMIKIITGFQNNLDVDIEKNPYLREMPIQKEKVRQKFENIDWDSDVDPWTYYDQYRERTPIWKTILELIVTLIVTSLIILLMIFIAGGFN